LTERAVVQAVDLFWARPWSEQPDNSLIDDEAADPFLTSHPDPGLPWACGRRRHVV